MKLIRSVKGSVKPVSMRIFSKTRSHSDERAGSAALEPDNAALRLARLNLGASVGFARSGAARLKSAAKFKHLNFGVIAPSRRPSHGFRFST